MSFPRYPKYKPSGVEWLGEVPEHWDVVALKRIASLKSGDSITGESIEETGNYPVLGGNGLRGFTSAFTHDGHFVVVGRQGALCGNINYATGKFWASEHAVVASPLKPVETVWLGEMLRAMELNQYSVSAAQPGLSMEFVGNLRTILPPFPEQTKIASFLDRETAKIDGLVGEQRRLIELLKEKRQAVISHAVTKGLNPHAPLKPSGIEWLGDVPEHWEMKRLGWICTDINDINHEMPEAVENGVLFLSAKDLLDDGTLNFETDVKMISDDDYERLSKKIRPRRGDIIYSRIGAALGKARLVETDLKFNVSYSCCVVRVMDEIACRQFIRVLLDGEMILTEARMRTNGIGVPDLALGEIARFPIPLPPIAEQRAIGAFLERETELLTGLIAEARRGIELLQERRTALISAAVTGQIDVRGLAETEVL